MKQKTKPSLELGQCVRPEAQAIAGDACMRGTLTSSTQPRWDMIKQERFNCPNYTCLEPVSGSPAGMCHAPCDPPTSSPTPETQSEEICAYRGSSAFDRCANKGNWSECIFASTQRGLRTACDEDTPCRNDYVCQRLFEFDPQASPRVLSSYERGYCVPNYFIFQLRLDGHPHRM